MNITVRKEQNKHPAVQHTPTTQQWYQHAAVAARRAQGDRDRIYFAAASRWATFSTPYRVYARPRLAASALMVLFLTFNQYQILYPACIWENMPSPVFSSVESHKV